MPSGKEGLRAQLLKEAEAAIDRMLASKKPAGTSSLSDIERLAMGVGQAVERSVAQILTAGESAAEKPPVCERCGGAMRSRGRRERRVVTEAGEVTLRRRYYVCPGCGKTVFPPR
jgi:uncharacterized protein with PIN domain